MTDDSTVATCRAALLTECRIAMVRRTRTETELEHVNVYDAAVCMARAIERLAHAKLLTREELIAAALAAAQEKP